MPWFRNKSDLIKEALLILAFSLTPLLWLSGNEIIFGHDSGFRLNYGEHLSNFLFAWNPYVNFGVDWSLYHGFIPIQGVETFFSYIFNSLSIGQRFTFIYWFFAIGVSLYVLLKYVFPEPKYKILRVISPVFYMYNFYILEGWVIAERAKFSLYIALPLMILLFFRTVAGKLSILRGGIYFGFMILLCNGGGSPPLFGALFITLIVLTAYFLVIYHNRWLRISMLFVVFGLSAILFNAYWIVPQIRLFAASYDGAVSSRGGIEGLIAWEKEISKSASIPNIIRFQGFPSWNNPEHPFADAYIQNPLLVVASWIPISIVFIGLVIGMLRHASVTQKQFLFFLLLLGVIGLFFTAGSHAPFGILYVYFMRHVPGFAMFRSSIYKFAPLVYLPIITFFGYYLSRFFHHLRLKLLNQILSSRLMGVIVACIVVLYHFPFITGDFFRFKLGFSTRIEVPDYVTELATSLREKTSKDDRVLLVPPLDVGYISSPIDTYMWGFYSLDILPRSLLNRSIVANDSNDDYVTRLLYKALWESDEYLFERLAVKAGLTHILWRGDVRLTEEKNKYWPLYKWKEKISNMSSIQLIKDQGPWSLYRLPGPSLPMVFVGKSVSFISRPAPDDTYILARKESQKQEVLLRLDPQQLDQYTPLAEQQFVEAECYLCKANEYQKLVESIVLPRIQSFPVSLLTNRKWNKEEQAIISAKTPMEYIDARLSAASSRLSSLINKRDTRALLSASETEKYQENVTKILDTLSALSDRNRDVYANRVIAFFDAHRRAIVDKEHLSYVVEIIDDSLERVRPLTWMSDNSDVYRFGVTVPQNGQYSFYIPHLASYDSVVDIDGVKFSTTKSMPLTTGYHHLAMVARNSGGTTDEIVSPVFLYRVLSPNIIFGGDVSFQRINSTRLIAKVQNATNPHTLVFNERFDPGWSIAINGIRQDFSHVEANGFANAWIVPKKGTYTISIYYRPQQYFYLGLLITCFSVFFATTYLVISAFIVRKAAMKDIP